MVGRRRRVRRLGFAGALTLAVVVPVAVGGGGLVEAGQWVRRTADRVANRRPVEVVQATADLVPMLYPSWAPAGLELVDAGYFPEGAPPDSNPSFHLVASDATGRLRAKIDRWTDASGYTGFVGAPGGARVTVDGVARPFVFPTMPVIPRKAGEHELTVGWQHDDSVVVATVLGAAPESEIRALAVQAVSHVEEVPGGTMRLRLFVGGPAVSSTLQLHLSELLERGLGDRPFQLAVPDGRTLIAAVVRPGTTAIRIDGPPGFVPLTLPARLSATVNVSVAAGLLPTMPRGTTAVRVSGLDSEGRTTWTVTRPAASVVR